MAAAMEVDEFPTLATASTTGQPQRRLTTLHPAKRPKPNDAGDNQESHLPEKALVQVAATMTQERRQAASQAEAPTQVSMRREERQDEGGSHVGHVLPTAATWLGAAEAERVADSDERGKQAKHSARNVSGDDETEDDAASAVSWASVEETTVGESCLEQGRCDGKENQEDRVEACKGPQRERRLSLKAQSGQETSASTCSECCNKKGDEDDARHGREALQFAGDKTPQQPRRTAHVQEGIRRRRSAKPHRTVQSQPVATAIRTWATTWRRDAAAWLGGKPTWRRGDEAEPRENDGRRAEGAEGSSIVRLVGARPSGPGAHTETEKKRTQRSTKKVRRDVAGHRRYLTPGSEHEEATSKQRSSQQSATGDVDTDSDSY
ncbi:hypothetical protein MRX96_038228 [Rhipicephalus microplus]